MLWIVSDDVARETVKGVHRDLVPLRANESCEAFPHIDCCRVSEGEAEDVSGARVRLFEDVANAQRKYLRLPRTWARYHHDGAVDGVHGEALLGVEAPIRFAKFFRHRHLSIVS